MQSKPTKTFDINLNKKFVKIPNKLAYVYVNNLKSFQGSNLFSRYDCYGTYVVYSFGWHFPILACVNGKWFKHLTKGSNTTSRHLNQICLNLTNITNIENITKFENFLANGGKL
ncbi:MAG: hypothetical protein Q8P20_01170 [bacterium]|nr:hypothetical protein [bacterium]